MKRTAGRLRVVLSSLADRLAAGRYPGADPVPGEHLEAWADPIHDRPRGTSGGPYSTGTYEARMRKRAEARRFAAMEVEFERRELELEDFAQHRLAFPASWQGAALDPVPASEMPDYNEQDAIDVALADLAAQGLAPKLLGEHMVYCRYSHHSTKHQPAWLALYEDHGMRLLVINADTARPLKHP